MASSISAGTTSSTALVATADTTGALELKTNNGTTALTLNASQAVGVGSTPSYGTAGQLLVSAGSSAAPNWSDALVLGTAVTLTNQTTVDFTNLPSWVKRVTVMFNGVSLSGTDQALIQLGYSGTPTYVTSGYTGGSQSLSTTPASGTTQLGTGFSIQNTAAANAVIGVMTLILLNSATNTWIATYTGYNSTVAVSWSNGAVALSGALTAVRLTRSGTNTFDAGVINILYE